MTSFDFVITVAIGSLLAMAAVATDWTKYFQAITAIGALLLIQFFLAKARIRFPVFGSVISNEPVVLFSNGAFNESALFSARVSKQDIWAKLREANALQVSNVQAVVLETTGDISVLHGGQIDPTIMTGVEQTRKHKP